MGILPYWDRNVDLEIVSWMPYGVDFSPVSVNALYSEPIGLIAETALELGSELFCIEGTTMGQVGSLFRENLILPGRNGPVAPGFSMVFGYSKAMETFLGLFADAYPGISAGLALCGVWDRSMLVDECKVIVLVSDNALFNEQGCITALSELLQASASENHVRGNSFFAEQFGYRRFSIPFETDDITELSITKLLFDFEFEATRQFVGPPPEVVFPNHAFEDVP